MHLTALFLFLTDYKLLMNDWRGYLIAGFALVWVANIYMSIFSFIRQDIKKEMIEIKSMEKGEENKLNQIENSTNDKK